MMPNTSKSNRRKGKSKFVPKPKQQWRTKEQEPKKYWRVKEQKRNWLELPYDVMANILYKVDVIDILENAQYVCSSWHKICKDPAMWRVIYMQNTYPNFYEKNSFQWMCKEAVYRSQGQLVDLTIGECVDDKLLMYIANRSSHLRRLELAECYGQAYDSWPEALMKFPLLEELGLYFADIPIEAIETAGHCCPKLRTLKINEGKFTDCSDDEIAIAIGENLPELRHLELIGNMMSNAELQVILDGCLHLESLDLRRCWNIDLKGELGKKCLKRIKCLKLPGETLEGYPYTYFGPDSREACWWLNDV